MGQTQFLNDIDQQNQHRRAVIYQTFYGGLSNCDARFYSLVNASVSLATRSFFQQRSRVISFRANLNDVRERG